ncbi:MAG: hypothetical protein JW928_01035 [Candidatus Aureabacteria bacterium]|nr:hypothetical protein [Candidatus Auribacterota bacterium]
MSKKPEPVSFFFFFLATLWLVCAEPAFASQETLSIVFFSSENCKNCDYVKDHVLPKAKDAFGNKITFRLLCVEETDNYLYFMQLEEQYGEAGNDFPIIFLQGKFLNGRSEIEKNLFSEIEKSLRQKAVLTEQKQKRKDISKKLGFLAIAAGGLLDGINPCVFTVIIFFISYLTYLKKGRKNIFLSGLLFILGCFFSYYLLGLGLFGFLEKLFFMKIVSLLIKMVVAVMVLLLALLNMKDSYLIARGKKMELHLETKSILKIHETIKKLTSFRLATPFSFLIGAIVSLIEFPCTGQIYIPIILLIKEHALKGYLYLFLYNIFFILPLIGLFIIIFLGMDIKAFRQFYSRHLLEVKIFFSVFFLFLFFLYIFSL